MRSAFPAAACAALILGATAPAHAQTVDQNVRCLLVSNLFENNAKEGQAKSVAAASKLFYAGRVSAIPEAQIQSAMAVQGKQINSTNAVATMTACAQTMDRALKTIQTVAGRLQKPKP